MEQETFELETIKWLKASDHKPPIDAECWVLTRTINKRLVVTYGVFYGEYWELFNGFNGDDWMAKDDEIISFFVLPTHETAPLFD